MRRAGRSQSVDRRWCGERQGDQGPGIALNPNDPRSFPQCRAAADGERLDTYTNGAAETNKNVLTAEDTVIIARTVQGFVDRGDRDGYLMYMVKLRRRQNRIRNEQDVMGHQLAEDQPLRRAPRQEIDDRRQATAGPFLETRMALSPREQLRRQRKVIDRRSLGQTLQLPTRSEPRTVAPGENMYEIAPSPVRELEREYQAELAELQEMEYDAHERGTRRQSF